MTTGSALDASGLRLVRKGRRVRLGTFEGTVTKANGPRAFVKWDAWWMVATCEHSNRLTVIDNKPKEARP
jgi:hypothetical protein